MPQVKTYGSPTSRSAGHYYRIARAVEDCLHRGGQKNQEAGRGDLTLQTTLFLPMLNALRRVLKKMLDSDSAVGRPVVLRAWREEPHSVVAVIPVLGEETGAFALYVTDDAADAIAQHLVEPSDEMTESAIREIALREMARMVVTIARRDKRLNRIQLGSPAARSTGPIGDMPQKLRPWITIPVSTSVGQVMLGLSLNTRRAADVQGAHDVDSALESIA